MHSMDGDRQVILKVQNLSYSYDSRDHVIKHINLDIRKGERVAVLGPNGAGKSTLFLLLNGVFRPEEGEISFRGEKIGFRNRNTLRKNVGFVFQEPDSQIVGSTVMSEVAFGPMNLKLPREEVETRTKEALAAMGLEKYRERPPHYLSGGEKKRVSIAGVLAMQPEILLFDEPAASLDPKNQVMLEELLLDLQEKGNTLLISTHDVNFAYRWADRILVLVEGELVADEEADRIFKNEKILQKANLDKPVLLQVYEVLSEKNSALLEKEAPRSIQEFQKLIRHSK